ncbi:MAG: TSUP family transporter [Parvibaculales bacterium]
MSAIALIVIWAGTLFTAAMSGIFGMTGGMILMGLLTAVLSVSATMVLHGLIQLTSNSYRAWLNREAVRWDVIRGYLLGSCGAVALFVYLVTSFDRPSPAIVYLCLGSLPFIAYALPVGLRLDITRPYMAPVCGVLIGTTNLVAGVAGPLLDVFFQRSGLTRHEVVASKAMTQVIAHIIKIFFYGYLAETFAPTGEAVWPALWVLAGCMIFSVLGTRLGKIILDAMTDTDFFIWTGRIMAAVGLTFILRGTILLMN